MTGGLTAGGEGSVMAACYRETWGTYRRGMGLLLGGHRVIGGL